MKSEDIYVVGPAVSGRHFFGRGPELNALRARLGGGMSCLLAGQRRIGKSSILKQLGYLQKEEGDSQPIQVFIDGMSLGGTNTDRVAQAILHAIGRSLSNQPIAVAKVLRVIEGIRTDHRWRIVDALEQVKRNGVSLLLFFDEIESIFREDNRDSASWLRSLISMGHIVMLATTFHWPEVRSPASPWYNVFNLIPLGLLTRDDATSLLVVPPKYLGVDLDMSVVDFAIDLFGCHPFYLQAFGFSLFADLAYASATEEDKRALPQQAARRVFTDLKWHIDYLLNQLSEDELNTLLRVADGKSVKDHAILDSLLWYDLISIQDEKPHLTSRFLEHFLAKLPRPTLSDRIGESGLVKGTIGVLNTCFDKAVGAAVDAASKKYLGS